MKLQKTASLLLAAVFGAGCLAACAPPDDPDDGKELTDKALSGEYLADFTKGDPGEKVLFATNGYTNGGGFNTYWDKEQVAYSDGAMHLSLAENPDGSFADRTQWSGGEARTTYYYGYGDYEVRMKPADSVGTASTFFVCTGDYDVWPDGTPNPWDEVDIEFLGQDPTKVQFNYFVNGQGGHEHMYDLGFDASKDYHNYGFRWAEDYITWFVDGKPVYRVEKPAGGAFPKTAGRVLMNYWAGGSDDGSIESWMGRYKGPDGKTADYQWIKTSAVKQSPPSGDPYAPAPGDAYDGNWDEIAASPLGFASTNEYTVTPAADNMSAQIVYTNVAGGSYANVQSDITAAAEGHSFVRLTVKNNGQKTANVRVNVMAGGKTINAAASQDGEKVKTDLVYGGSFFEIGAGKTAVCEVKFAGIATALQLMIDSATEGDKETHSGDLTVSDLKFAGEGVEPPKGDGIDWDGIEAADLAFASNNEYVVSLSEDHKSATVAYENVTLNYHNVETDVTAAAADKDHAHLTVKNNGEQTVNLRVNLVNDALLTEGAKNSAVNKSATQNGAAVRTDVEWGGSFFEIPSGASAELVIVYEGVANKLQLMIDSAINDDTATHSGNITVSALKFAAGGESGSGDLPTADNKGVTVNGAKLAVEGNTDAYVVISDGTSASMRVAYQGLTGGGYQNLNMNVAGISRDKNVFTVKIANNGGAAVSVRVDVNSVKKVEQTNACNLSATQDGEPVGTDTVYGGSTFTVGAGETAVCVVTYDTSRGPERLFFYFDSATYGDTNVHSGDVTLSEMAFSGTGSYTPDDSDQPTGEPVALTFNVEEGQGYTVTAGEENKSATIDYTGVGGTYKPVTAECASLAAGSDTFTVTIKNNKAAEVTVRVDVQGTTRVSTGADSGTDCTNTSQSNEGGSNCYTDTTWGGTFITLAANEEATLTIYFDATMEQGAVKNILVYVDSATGSASDQRDASVTVSGFLFTKKA